MESIIKFRGGSRAAASKMERFVIIINSFQPLTIITKCSILDVAAALDLPLKTTITSPAGNYMSKVNSSVTNGVVLVSLMLTLNVLM